MFLPGLKTPPLEESGLVVELVEAVRSRLALARLTLAFLRGMGVEKRRAMYLGGQIAQSGSCAFALSSSLRPD